ncbi:endonuclease III [bacterium]|nr:endonuclease III [bacterium]
MSKLEKILTILQREYPHAKTALQYSDPFHLLIATILSAQSTDKQINALTPALFKKFGTAAKLAAASLSDIEKLIRSSGFYKNKARNIKECAQKLVKDFGGRVPQTMEELVTLRGVGRKTGNVVLSEAFQINVGVCVDTHVARVSQRLGLTHHADPLKIEQDLMAATSSKNWKKVTNLLITHGREVCHARSPQCEVCVLQKDCDYLKKN